MGIYDNPLGRRDFLRGSLAAAALAATGSLAACATSGTGTSTSESSAPEGQVSDTNPFGVQSGSTVEQLVSFWFICVFSITVFSTLAYSTVFGKAIAGQANLAFIRAEGEALKQVVAPWFGTFFWVFGALSMILVALGTVDYIARIVADVLKTVYLQSSERWTESRVYFVVAWGTIAAGSIILLSGFNQPLLLLVTAACLNGMVMFVYSILLIQLNRRGLPPALRVSGFRLGMLVFATVFYGFFAGWLVIEQLRAYLAAA